VLLGTISYPLYLTHQNIGYVVIRAGYRLGLNPNVSVALAFGVALAIAAAITFTVERPAMALLRKRRPQWLGGQHAPRPAPQLPVPTPVATAG
jgi:peptidoglycan/LPS O-acetylase OafA/YrhL